MSILSNFNRFCQILLGFLIFEPKMVENLESLSLDSKDTQQLHSNFEPYFWKFLQLETPTENGWMDGWSL